MPINSALIVCLFIFIYLFFFLPSAFLVFFAYFFCYPHFFHPHFSILIFPSASAIHRYPVRVLQPPTGHILGKQMSHRVCKHQRDGSAAQRVLRRARIFSLESGRIFRVSEPSAFLGHSRHLGYRKQTKSRMCEEAKCESIGLRIYFLFSCNS